MENGIIAVSHLPIYTTVIIAAIVIAILIWYLTRGGIVIE